MENRDIDGDMDEIWTRAEREADAILEAADMRERFFAFMRALDITNLRNGIAMAWDQGDYDHLCSLISEMSDRLDLARRLAGEVLYTDREVDRILFHALRSIHLLMRSGLREDREALAEAISEVRDTDGAERMAAVYKLKQVHDEIRQK